MKYFYPKKDRRKIIFKSAQKIWAKKNKEKLIILLKIRSKIKKFGLNNYTCI